VPAQTVSTERAPAAIGPYSQGVIANGLLFTAGQIALDPASGQIVGGDFGAQAERVFANVKLAVEAGGATMADIVKMNTYIVASVDPADVPKMREVRSRYLGGGTPPASTLVYVSRLAQPGWLIEVEVVAAID